MLSLVQIVRIYNYNDYLISISQMFSPEKKSIKKEHQKTTPLFIPGRTHAFLSACRLPKKNAEDFRCFLTSEPPGAMQGKLWDLIPEPILQRLVGLVGLVPLVG